MNINKQSQSLSRAIIPVHRLWLFFIASMLLSGNLLLSQEPYELKWEREAAIFGIGVGAATTGFFLEDAVEPSKPEDIAGLKQSDVNWFDRSACSFYSHSISDISDVSVIVVAAAPALLFMGKEARNDFFTISGMYAETMAFVYGLPSIVKGSVSRYRPYVYNDEAPIGEKLDPEARKSFFSGHTMTAFASAVFLSTVYSDYYPDSKSKGWVWGGSLVAAAAVGFSRYISGNHYPTDIITGALVGSAVGYLIPYLHRTTKTEGVSAIPMMNTGGFSIGLTFKL